MGVDSVVIIVNWNGWEDTVRCINACGCMCDFDGAVLVVDNGSTDGSLQKLEAWASGELDIAPSFLGLSVDESAHIVNKPLQLKGVFNEESLSQNIRAVGLARRSWYLIEAKSNKGFGAGNNIGLRAAAADPSVDFFWLLNNDTEPAQEAYSSLLAYMAAHPNVGLCGSTLLYMNISNLIQAVGGEYNSWLGTSKHVLSHRLYSKEICADVDVSMLDYIVGASMFVRRSVLERVGFLAEEYFLYSEEIDWATRLKREMPELTLGYAPNSLVYHKEGASTGANEQTEKTYSYFADYFFITSRIKFARKFYPGRRWCVQLSMLWVAFNRMRRGQWKSVLVALCTFIGWIPAALDPRYFHRKH